MSNLDYCPECNRRITDSDENGCETENGQRYCLNHKPDNYFDETSKIQTIKNIYRMRSIRLLDAKTVVDMWDFDHNTYAPWDQTDPEEFNNFVNVVIFDTYLLNEFRKVKMQKYAAMTVVQEGFDKKLNEILTAIRNDLNPENF